MALLKKVVRVIKKNWLENTWADAMYVLIDRICFSGTWLVCLPFSIVGLSVEDEIKGE